MAVKSWNTYNLWELLKWCNMLRKYCALPGHQVCCFFSTLRYGETFTNDGHPRTKQSALPFHNALLLRTPQTVFTLLTGNCRVFNFMCPRGVCMRVYIPYYIVRLMQFGCHIVCLGGGRWSVAAFRIRLFLGVPAFPVAASVHQCAIGRLTRVAFRAVWEALNCISDWQQMELNWIKLN